MNIAKMIGKDRIEKGLFWNRAWTLVEGCTPVSAGCDYCWAAAQTHRFGVSEDSDLWGKKDFTTNGKFNGKIICREDRLDLPLKVKKPQVWAIWNDLFHEDVPFEFLDKAFFNMQKAISPHIFLIITKRPERMAEYINFTKKQLEIFHGGESVNFPGDNVCLIVTCENQEQADKRIPILLQIPAAVRGVICEPLLGPIDLTDWLPQPGILAYEVAEAWGKNQDIDWILCGGETGPHARPCHPDWVRKLRDDCVKANTPFFFKSWGEYLAFQHDYPGIVYARNGNPGETDGVKFNEHFIKDIEWSEDGDILFANVGKKSVGRLLDGRTWDQLPEVKP